MTDVSNYPTHKQTYEPIATQTLSSAASSVTFSNIPQTFKDLVIQIFNKDSGQGLSKYIRFNDDSGGNYSRTFIYGNGSTVTSGRNSNQTYMDLPTTTEWGVEHFYIMSYTNSNIYKTTLYDFSLPSYFAGDMVSLWRSTSAITSINIASSGVTFQAGATFSLYGIAG